MQHSLAAAGDAERRAGPRVRVHHTGARVVPKLGGIVPNGL